ncbi:hypothetical protein MATL_G00263810 [Megalops atlanticus]|uniref:Uncharacterized protein n=1 Tax=Megalops atlanticus TaxID=7932 RepID=A0A9D3P873_MEGAT|nr:hypothetical protein MATL_G00263810 [Megalops atlanticus]
MVTNGVSLTTVQSCFRLRLNSLQTWYDATARITQRVFSPGFGPPIRLKCRVCKRQQFLHSGTGIEVHLFHHTKYISFTQGTGQDLVHGHQGSPHLLHLSFHANYLLRAGPAMGVPVGVLDGPRTGGGTGS